jgi:hypothetical protein
MKDLKWVTLLRGKKTQVVAYNVIRVLGTLNGILDEQGVHPLRMGVLPHKALALEGLMPSVTFPFRTLEVAWILLVDFGTRFSLGFQTILNSWRIRHVQQ